MIFKQLFDTKSSTYTYIIASAKGREAMIIDPVIENANRTLIALIDRIRMLDNDLIRLNTKLNMILEYERKQGNEKSKKDKRGD